MGKITLGMQVIFAVVLGIFVGLFFGPLCSVFQPIGEVYVMLLQMVALPYIGISLIHGVGSMTPKLCKKLLKGGWFFWLLLWVVVILTIYYLYLIVPTAPSLMIRATEERGRILAKDLINYLVPENPFYDLVNNVVPAIAVTGLIFGAALMHLEKKEPVLSFLERGNEMIEKILMWLALISPIGIFARLAAIFGTVQFEEIHAFKFYILFFIGASLFLTFWVLPAIISSFTPLKFKEALVGFFQVALLPFATALPTLALPFIVKYMKDLGEKDARGDPRFHVTTQTVMPICYSFAQIGNCMILLFLLFLSFYFYHPFTMAEKGVLLLFSFPMSVGSSTTSQSAISFLIHQLGFPAEATLLFMQTLYITINFQVLVSCCSILTLIILVLYSYYGKLHIQWKKALFHLSGIFLFLFLFFLIVKPNFQLEDSFSDRFFTLRINDVIPDPVDAEVFTTTVFRTEKREEALSEILRTGILRVGYSPLDQPYSFLNTKGELVGYDISFAYQLARDLDCKLQFIPIDYSRFLEQIEQGEFHIAMSGIVMDEERIRYMDFTHSYDQENIVLLVSQKKASEFLDLNALATRKDLTLGAVGAYIPIAKRHFPLAKLVTKASYDPLLQGEIDALISIEATAYTWVMNHTDYVVIDYSGALGTRYLSYPIPSMDFQWLSFLNNWLALKKESGFTDRMDRFWLQGERLDAPERRWSILQMLLKDRVH